MNNTDTELAGKTPAFVGWIQVIGALLFLSSLVSALKNYRWLSYTGAALILTGYLLKIYFDWKAGNRKAAKTRLIFLVAIIAVSLILGYFGGQR